MTNTKTTSLNYRDAGVDIDAGNQLIENIKPAVKRTLRPEVLGDLGGFGGLFGLDTNKYKEPVLVSGADGVGTKLKLALALNRHSTIGIDLVAMCVNDILVQGAEPLFFLDYYATGQLDIKTATDVITGIAAGCEQAGAALIGGETAEMPGMYTNDEYDLAGFCVGIVEKNKVITGKQVEVGNCIIGLSSSGPHSNGYSLIRKVLDVSEAKLEQDCGNTNLGDALLAPTKIYVKPILKLLEDYQINAIAHITGGGLLENIPRVMPEYTQANITPNWPQQAVFEWLENAGNIKKTDMYRTFNCGIGLVLCVNPNDADNIIAQLKEYGEDAFKIGEIEKSVDMQPSVHIAS